MLSRYTLNHTIQSVSQNNMRNTDFLKLMQISKVWGKGYSTPAKAFKTVLEDRYMVSSGFYTNGYWAFPEKFLPNNFKDIKAKKENFDIKKKFEQVIQADKKEMHISSLYVDETKIYVVLECAEFKSYFNPEFFSLIRYTRYAFGGIKLWQENALAPVLVDSEKDESIMMIMPVKLPEVKHE